MAHTFAVADGIHGIDTLMFGREGATSAYLVEAREPALVETGPTTSLEALLAGLADLGVGPGDLAHVIVTHIHLDHAGGAGALAPHFPDATIWVHERGAPHLSDPTKLLASATRVYGAERLAEMFGSVDPVPAERLRALTDGDVIALGDRRIEAVYTPGHASHHVCLFDDRTGGVWVGDALGVFLPDVRILRPATPPPEFDLELAIESIDRVAAREPRMLMFSHFGPATDVGHLCSLAVRRVRKWTAIVEEALGQTDDPKEVARILRERTQTEINPAGARTEALEDRYDLLSSIEMNAMGLSRYLRKRAEAKG
ncbi:MAG TPA: MBL fold metallo-hydrolase [Actinomycetota bacterium]|nr:MBL fold metallo-hydrolase [Actinomycetota bacterium]